jgi:hypothetical protein
MGGGYLTQPFYHMAPRQTMPYSTSDFGLNKTPLLHMTSKERIRAAIEHRQIGDRENRSDRMNPTNPNPINPALPAGPVAMRVRLSRFDGSRETGVEFHPLDTTGGSALSVSFAGAEWDITAAFSAAPDRTDALDGQVVRQFPRQIVRKADKSGSTEGFWGKSLRGCHHCNHQTPSSVSWRVAASAQPRFAAGEAGDG